MASERQIAANRRNAMRSTGPRTSNGKNTSRRNAYRYGLTAETVIASMEDARNYRALERMLLEDYAPDTVMERQLVVRLASLLWRLRRATMIETGLFELNSGVRAAPERPTEPQCSPRLQVFYDILRNTRSSSLKPSGQTSAIEIGEDCTNGSDRARNVATAYRGLSHTSPKLISRLSRYETALWRQVAQTLVILQCSQLPKFRITP